MCAIELIKLVVDWEGCRLPIRWSYGTLRSHLVGPKRHHGSLLAACRPVGGSRSVSEYCCNSLQCDMLRNHLQSACAPPSAGKTGCESQRSQVPSRGPSYGSRRRSLAGPAPRGRGSHCPDNGALACVAIGRRTLIAVGVAVQTISVHVTSGQWPNCVVVEAVALAVGWQARHAGLLYKSSISPLCSLFVSGFVWQVVQVNSANCSDSYDSPHRHPTHHRATRCKSGNTAHRGQSWRAPRPSPSGKLCSSARSPPAGGSGSSCRCSPPCGKRRCSACCYSLRCGTRHTGSQSLRERHSMDKTGCRIGKVAGSQSGAVVWHIAQSFGRAKVTWFGFWLWLKSGWSA